MQSDDSILKRSVGACIEVDVVGFEAIFVGSTTQEAFKT